MKTLLLLSPAEGLHMFRRSPTRRAPEVQEFPQNIVRMALLANALVRVIEIPRKSGCREGGRVWGGC